MTHEIQWPGHLPKSYCVTRKLFVRAVFIVALIVGNGRAHAQTFTTLYNFSGGTDGGSPYVGQLLLDGLGNVYGNASSGGDLSCNSSRGCGVVFKLDSQGNEKVVHTFAGPDGAEPQINLVENGGGGAYGVTLYGGNGPCSGHGMLPDGCGTVFEVDSHGNESVLYSFLGAPDGRAPSPGLVRDAAGNLYGTTEQGGASNLGTVFKVDASGRETVLYSFSGTDGQYPEAGLVQNKGTLYGTTSMGGAFGDGTVFSLKTNATENRRLTLLYSFGGVGDGQKPYAGLAMDAAGELYGTTSSGGAFGLGTVFRLSTRTGAESVLYSFAGGPVDGSVPYASVLLDPQGNIYGTTWNGGEFGDGTVFELGTTGAESLLHSFNGTDGKLIYGGLVRNAAGTLYGTTLYGGAFSNGTVFKLDQ